MPFSVEVKTDMFARSMRHCCLCRKQCGTNIEAAHIIDEAAGGSNDSDNGIPVCFDCHQEMGAYRESHPKGNKFRPEELKARRNKVYELVEQGLLPDSDKGIGGDGGSGEIAGNRGVIFGGRGGAGGVSGRGGKGGGGFVRGDDAVIVGGDGGDAATSDGRSGRGARGPTERFGFPTELWGFGRGGSAANHPEYDRRIALLAEIRQEYIRQFPEDARYIEAGVETVPIDWVNQRLSERGESWSVTKGEEGFVLPALSEVATNRQEP